MSIRGITFVNQIVKSDDDASLHNMLLSGRSGVMKGCSTTFDSSHIYVTSGQFVILGRQIEVQGTETITPEAVAEGKKYCRLVFEIDLSKINTTETFGQGYFKVLSSSVSYPSVIQEDLTAGGTVYQYPWARFTLTVNGIANFANDTTVLQFSVDDVLSALSENPVQNKVVYKEFEKILDGTQQVGDTKRLGGQAPSFYGKASEVTTVGDTRTVDTDFADYPNKLVFLGIKDNEVIGMADQLGEPYTPYSYVFGLLGWSDQSAGMAHELAFNDHGIFRRTVAADNSKSPWYKITDSTDLGHERLQQVLGTMWLSTSILEKALEVGEGVYSYILGGSYYTGEDLPNGSWAYGLATIYKRGVTSISVVLHYEGSNRSIINSYNGAWTGWGESALVSDFTNYLQLTGGTLYSPNTPHPLFIDNGDNSNNLSVIPFRKQGTNLGFIGFSGTNNPVILSNDGAELGKVIHSANYNSYALSIHGGKLAVGAAVDFTVHSSGGNAVGPYFYNGDGSLFGGVGIYAENGVGKHLFIGASTMPYTLGLTISPTNIQWYGADVHHDGNSAKVAIQSTAPADGLWVW